MNQPPTARSSSPASFDAPRELAWQAMTDPRHVVQWWGPRGFTTTIQEMDVRPGGVWTHVMHGPDGTDYPNHSVFQEVVYPERIVFAHGGGKAGGSRGGFHRHLDVRGDRSDKTQVTIRMVVPHGGGARHRRQGIRRHRGRQADPRTPGGTSSDDGLRGSAYRHRAPRRCSARLGVPVLDRSAAHGALVGAARLHQPGLRA